MSEEEPRIYATDVTDPTIRNGSKSQVGWDRNGYAIWQKKIESEEKFHWPRLLQEDVVTLTAEQLNWLLDGYDVWSAPHRMIRFTHVS